ncbi:MAG: hypothetical protein K9N06_10855 [Candidatus Cloacimonetes bacterium]|nr:hypothetical protein [Candidatus Cloacimonadota bacterium]
MNKNSILVLMTLLIFPVLLMSIDYELNHYKAPDHHEFGWSLYLTNSGYLNRINGTNGRQISGSISSSLLEEVFTRDHYLYLKNYCRFSRYLSEKTKDDSTELVYKRLSGYPKVDLDIIYRKYLLNDWFLGSSVSGQYARDYNKEDTDKITSDAATERIGTDYGLTFELGSGYGRIEDITEVRQALYILEDLEKAGLLKRVADADDVTRLADLLVSLKHLRLFDIRLQQQEIIRQLVNHLKGSALIDDTELENLLIIDDLYDYGASYERRSGWVIMPVMRLSYLQNEYFVESTDNKSDPDENDFYSKGNREESTCRYGIALKSDYLHNYGKNWQLEATSDLGYFLRDWEYKIDYYWQTSSSADTTNSRREDDYNEIALNLDLKLNWYIDTRTRLGAEAAYSFYQTTDADSLEYPPLGYEYRGEEQIFNLSLFADYYISPRFLLYFSISAENKKIRDHRYGSLGEYVKPDSFDLEYNLKFSYDLF